jgi:hypothetical protein
MNETMGSLCCVGGIEWELRTANSEVVVGAKEMVDKWAKWLFKWINSRLNRNDVPPYII